MKPGVCNHPFSHATVENLSELNSTYRHISGRGSRLLHRRGRLKSSVNYFVIPCHVRRTLHRRNVIMCSVSGRWPPQANKVKIIDFSKTTLILSCSQRADHGTLRGSASLALVHEKVWSKVNWLLDQVNLFCMFCTISQLFTLSPRPSSGHFEKGSVESTQNDRKYRPATTARNSHETRPLSRLVGRHSRQREAGERVARHGCVVRAGLAR